MRSNKLITTLSIAAMATASLGSTAYANQGADDGSSNNRGACSSHSSGCEQNRNHGRSHQRVAYLFKGTVTAVAADSVSLKVESGNRSVTQGGFVGQTVQFKLTQSHSSNNSENDSNDDSTSSPIKVGDSVVALSKLKRGVKYDPNATLLAKHIALQTQSSAADPEHKDCHHS